MLNRVAMVLMFVFAAGCVGAGDTDDTSTEAAAVSQNGNSQNWACSNHGSKNVSCSGNILSGISVLPVTINITNVHLNNNQLNILSNNLNNLTISATLLNDILNELDLDVVNIFINQLGIVVTRNQVLSCVVGVLCA